MECPHCGFFHLTAQERCARCRKPIPNSPAGEVEPVPLSAPRSVTPEEPEVIALLPEEVPTEDKVPFSSSSPPEWEIETAAGRPPQGVCQATADDEAAGEAVDSRVPAEAGQAETSAGVILEWDETTDVLEAADDLSLQNPAVPGEDEIVAALLSAGEESLSPHAPDPSSSADMKQSLAPPERLPAIETGATWNDVSLPETSDEVSAAFNMTESLAPPPERAAEVPASNAGKNLPTDSPQDLLSLMSEHLEAVERENPKSPPDHQLLDNLYSELFASSPASAAPVAPGKSSSSSARPRPAGAEAPALRSPAERPAPPAPIKENSETPSSLLFETDLSRDRSIIEIRDQARAAVKRETDSEEQDRSAKPKGIRVVGKTAAAGNKWKIVVMLVRRSGAGLADLLIWGGIGFALFKAAIFLSGYPSFHGTAREWILLVVLPLLGMTALLALVYGALFGSILGRTPGMILFGLRLAGPEGDKPGPGRALLRTAVFLAGLLTLGFAWLITLFDPAKLNLSDRLSGVRIERA